MVKDNLKCILFDLDGTLIDSRDVIVEAVFATTEHFLPGRFKREDIIKRFGESFDDFYDRTVPFLPVTVTKEHLLNTYFDFYHNNAKEVSGTFSFVREGILHLRRLGYCLGIVTNNQRELTLDSLKHARLSHLFDTIVTIDDVRIGKPSPLPIIKAMRDLKVKPSETMMVGDSIYDLEAARGAQVKSIILEWYGHKKWNNPLPDYIFTNFQQFCIELFQAEKSVG